MTQLVNGQISVNLPACAEKVQFLLKNSKFLLLCSLLPPSPATPWKLWAEQAFFIRQIRNFAELNGEHSRPFLALFYYCIGSCSNVFLCRLFQVYKLEGSWRCDKQWIILLPLEIYTFKITLYFFKNLEFCFVGTFRNYQYSGNHFFSAPFSKVIFFYGSYWISAIPVSQLFMKTEGKEHKKSHPQNLMLTSAQKKRKKS